MLFLSDFADLGLVLPLAGLVAVTLVALGRLREAFAWCLAIAGTLGTMGLLKVLVFVLVGSQSGDGLNNPSGHTASGTVVYAGLLALVGGRFAPRVSIALLAGLAFGLLFGFSRVELQVHTLADVLVGGAVGLAGAVVLVWLAGPHRADARSTAMPVVGAVALVAMLAFHGQRLIAESELRAIAAHIQSVSDHAFN
jgi:membrane-associated phospholipid phosphatase